MPEPPGADPKCASEAPSAPRLGAIDAGTNAIRMVIADASDPDQLVALERLRVPVRLGRGTFMRGQIDADTIAAAVDAFSRFRALFEQHQVSRYRAVATSAVRNAKNRDQLLHRLYHDAGIDLEVIDGHEEARLVRKAVLHAFPDHAPPRLIFDLGGGSLEVNAYHHGRWHGQSLPVGTVRLLESFGLTGAIGADGAAMVRRYAATMLQAAANDVGVGQMPAAVCGGNAEALARLLGDTDADGMPGFELAALESALPELLEADVEQRMERFAVRRDRAEVLGVAALVLATVGRSLQLTRMVVPGVGIRDALLLDAAEGLAAAQAEAERAHGKALLTAARTFAGRLRHDLRHGEQVCKLARSLFDQLADMHGLSSRYRTVLEVAALLHDVGEVVNARSHHKHSEYMILWGKIAGLESPEREMVAALARAHRKSSPDPRKHTTYASLDRDQRIAVRRLAALLRLADGLDTAHREQVEQVIVGRAGQQVSLDLILSPGEPSEPGEPETLGRKSAMFEAEFGYGVTVTVAPHPPDVLP